MPLPRPKTLSEPAPLANFAPDNPPNTPGAVQDGYNVYPVTKGTRTFPGLTALGAGLPGPCMGYFAGFLVGTPVFVAATAGSLYVADATGRNLIQSAGGFANTVNRWRFAAYGTPGGGTQDLIAVNASDPPQYYQTATGTWQVMPNGIVDGSAPVVSSIVTASDYALIFVQPQSQNFISTFNEFPPAWGGSEPLQVYQQSIPQSPGYITACHRLRNGVVFYKPTAAHVGYFAGGLTGWDIQDNSIQQGVLNHEWVINTGDYHFFPSLGGHDFWQFDGWNLTPLANQLAEFFFQDHDDGFMSSIVGAFDSERSLLVWAYPSKQANPRGTIDTWLIYNLRTQTWAFQRLSIEFLISWLDPVDSHFKFGYFGTDHTPRIYDDTVAPGRSYVTSNWFGDYRFFYATNRLRSAFSVLPQSATVTPVNVEVGGQIPPGPPGDAALVPGAIIEPLSDDGWFNFQVPNRARNQCFQIVMEGLGEIISIEPDMTYAGDA